MTAPCAPWIAPANLACDDVTLTPAQAEQAVNAATSVLWALGGRRHGICTATVRPCAPRCSPDGWHRWGTPWKPMLYGGEWLNTCHHQVDCACGPVPSITLPLTPVASITSVQIGADLALTAGVDYRLDGRDLVRLGGERWPVCQDMLAAPGTAGAFVVTFTYGTEVDDLGIMAVTELACEFGKALAGSSKCRLPARITSLTRQGTSMTFLDPQDFLTQGRVGLYLADLWLASVNPGGLTRPSGIYSPDRPRPRYV